MTGFERSLLRSGGSVNYPKATRRPVSALAMAPWTMIFLPRGSMPKEFSTMAGCKSLACGPTLRQVPPMIRGLFWLFYRLIALGVLVVVVTAVWMVADGLNDQGSHADVAVVLGNAIQKNGVPAPILRARLAKAIDLFQKGEYPLIIVSGATRLGGDEPAAMCNYLVEHQVPIAAIV